MQNSIVDVQQFLTGHFNAPIHGLELVGRQGEWSRAYTFSVKGAPKIVRFSAVDEDFRKDAIAASLASPWVPAPPIEAIGEVFDGYYAISPRIDGVLIEDLEAVELRRTMPALYDLFLALRRVDISTTSGYGGFDTHGNGAFPSWKAYLENAAVDQPSSRTAGWLEKLSRNQAAYTTYQKAHDLLYERLEVVPEERCLVHNDLLHYNLLVQDGHITGVIDWGCALYGDFLYDLAMYTTWQFYYPAMHGINILKDARDFFAARGVQTQHFEERVQCYQIHLLLDSISYNAFKENQENLALTIQRLREILSTGS
jgi:hygromycin-B 4-O-kinase